MLHQLSQAVLGAVPNTGNTAATAASSPSNQDIIDAAKRAYSQYQGAVDASALALVNLIVTGSQTAAITRLDNTNWNSPGISPDIADPIFGSQDVQSAIGVARTFHALNSLSVGVYAQSIPGGGVGMVGFDRNLAGSETAGITLTLDLYKSVVSTTIGSNLQLSLWLGAAGQLHDNVVGLYISTTIQTVAVNLKMLLSPTLAPYGFAVSTGATLNLPVTSGVFAGATATWS